MADPTAEASAGIEPAPASSNTRVGEPAALALAAASGIIYWLGFTQAPFVPLAFVSLVPLLVALRGRSGFRAFRLGWLFGTLANAGGFYWIVGMLRTFSGFPTAVCALFSGLLYVAQGLQFALLAWLIACGDARRVPRVVSVPAALAAVELCFPLLFPTYTTNSLQGVLGWRFKPWTSADRSCWGCSSCCRTLRSSRR